MVAKKIGPKNATAMACSGLCTRLPVGVAAMTRMPAKKAPMTGSKPSSCPAVAHTMMVATVTVVDVGALHREHQHANRFRSAGRVSTVSAATATVAATAIFSTATPPVPESDAMPVTTDSSSHPATSSTIAAARIT
ncbi:Uncharacterised protein [Mycobacteroides abscessus subsp. abscessus]|nr:Uncharacterised protein [Mycobacteroides abscessus subsp. abscessus]